MVICPRCSTQNQDFAAACARCGIHFAVQPQKKSNVPTILLITAIILVTPCLLCGVFGMIGSVVTPPNPDRTSQTGYSNTRSLKSDNPTPQPASTPRPTPTPEPKGLVLVSAKWEKGGFGAVAIWRVTIKNESDTPLGDIKYRTVYISESGNTVGKGGIDSLLGKDTIEKIVPAKKSRTFEVNDGFINDEADRADFQIVSWREIQ